MLSLITYDWQVNLGSGAVLMVIELILVYFVIGLVISQQQKRQENRMWRSARRDFVAKALFSLANASYTISKLCSETEGRKHFSAKFEYAAALFGGHCDNLESLTLKYSRAMPPDWLYTAALVTERIKTARHWLIFALEHRVRYAEFVEGAPGDLGSSTLPRAYIKATQDNGVQFLTPGNRQDDLKALMSEALYAVGEEVIRAVDTLSEFVERTCVNAELDETEILKDLVRKKQLDCEALKRYLAVHSAAIEAMMSAVVSGEFHFGDLNHVSADEPGAAYEAPTVKA